MKEITNPLYEEISKEFETKFRFVPSIAPKKWPSILEPTPSFTLLMNKELYEQNNLSAFFSISFNQLPDEHKIMYQLNWHHQYYYAPKLFEYVNLYDPYDYEIALNKNMLCGTFSHPWEETLCIYGKELAAATKANLPQQLKIIRERT